MGRKEYRFDHGFGVEGAKEKLDPELKRIAEKYGLTRECRGNAYILKRSGVDVTIDVAEKIVMATVDLSWLLETTLRGQIEEALNRKVKQILG